MAKTVSNTLTRWHKIAERLKTASQQLQESMTRALQVGQGLDLDAFLVRKDTLRAGVEKAVSEQLDLCLALQGTLFTIRRALAEANVKCGVAALLGDLERAKQELGIYERLLETTESAMTEAEYEDLARRRAGADANGRQMYGASVSFMSGATQQALEERRAAARLLHSQLSDQLADANASKLVLDIPEHVAKFVGI